MSGVDLLPRRIHLVGIGGVHMSAIAQALLAQGHEVSGSDIYLSSFALRAQEQGARVFEGHRPENLGAAELVVVTSAVGPNNPEVAEARRRRIPIVKRAEMIARLLEGRRVIAIAGSHGKTTTTALIAYMLHEDGLKPTFFLGGEMVNLRANAAWSDGPYGVVEADEYDAAFLSYSPHIAVVTNIEADHLDFYGTFENMVAAFRHFLGQASPEGVVIAGTDDPTVVALVRAGASAAPVEGYGLKADGLWQARAVEPAPDGGYAFTAWRGGRPYSSFEIRLWGLHNVANALAAIALGHFLGLSLATMQRALAHFRGVARRFQRIGEAAGVVVMDDYAHHPTEVRATLAAAKERFPDRRLVVLFQPHTYSRSRYLLEGFQGCFEGVHELYVADTYAAREEPAAGMGAEELAQAIVAPRARYLGPVAAAARQVARRLRPGDVFFTIGAGDVDRAAFIVLEELSKSTQPAAPAHEPGKPNGAG